MFSFSRNSRGIIANWWWTIDKTLLLCLSLLIIIGAFLNFTASPAVANRIGFGSYHFIKRQLLFLPIAYLFMTLLSMQRLKTIRRIAIVGYVIAIVLLLCTIFTGYETKGASRWIKILGFSLQPSEFVKPTFIVVSAWLFDGQLKNKNFPGNIISAILFVFTAFLLIKQPDFGMTIIISLIWGFQLFLSGLSLTLVSILASVFIVGGVLAYFTLDHVHTRVQQFLESENNLSFQVKKSLEAFQSGNIFGKGPGEGIVKAHIPDAHTDFIFAVAAEEFGIILCLIIIALFTIIVIRSMYLSMKDNNFFIILAGSGLAASFGLQAFINMASTVHLIPTKGMTLPFISYGGSSLLATALSMGILLAITRKNVHAEDSDDK
ncbi:MAG: putative peptidoglycan glycosyltransferase FtsW [Alphaproteobacteria bacterium]|nr:putative peptidoglycan glycosyltransferase FtsW [Alphaproteobacteria bacterium]